MTMTVQIVTRLVCATCNRAKVIDLMTQHLMEGRLQLCEEHAHMLRVASEGLQDIVTIPTESQTGDDR